MNEERIFHDQSISREDQRISQHMNRERISQCIMLMVLYTVNRKAWDILSYSNIVTFNEQRYFDVCSELCYKKQTRRLL